MTARYKIVVNKAEAYTHNLPFEFKETADFDEVLSTIGRKTFRRTPGQDRAARARIDRDKIFHGSRSAQLIRGSVQSKTDSLEDLVARNDIRGYAETWRALNHLTT